MGKFKLKKPSFAKSPTPMKSPFKIDPPQAPYGALARALGATAEVSSAVAIPISLFGMYKSGQEHSGGRAGWEKNPNWDGVEREGDARFGGSEGVINTETGKFERDDGTAQFRRSYTSNTIKEAERRFKNQQDQQRSKAERDAKEKERREENAWNTEKRKVEQKDHQNRNNPDYGPYSDEYHDYPGSVAWQAAQGNKETTELSEKTFSPKTEYETTEVPEGFVTIGGTSYRIEDVPPHLKGFIK